MVSSVKSWLNRHEVAAYVVLAYVFSWAVGIPLGLAKQGWGDALIPYSWHYLYAFGPMLAALVMTAAVNGRGGIRELLSRVFRWRVAPVWWLVAFSPLLMYLLVAAGLRLFDGAWPDINLLGDVNFLPRLNLGVALLLWIVTFGLGEEVGWRGFMLPRLQQRHSAWRATLIVWAVWAAWHIPAFFYVIDPAMIVGWLLGNLSGAILFTWLYNSTGGSVLMVLLWHGSFDFITASAAGEGIAAAVISTAVMLWAVVILYRYRAQNLSPRIRHTI